MHNLFAKTPLTIKMSQVCPNCFILKILFQFRVIPLLILFICTLYGKLRNAFYLKPKTSLFCLVYRHWKNKNWAWWFFFFFIFGLKRKNRILASRRFFGFCFNNKKTTCLNVHRPRCCSAEQRGNKEQGDVFLDL